MLRLAHSRQNSTIKRLNKQLQTDQVNHDNYRLISAITNIIPTLSQHQLLYTLNMVCEMAEITRKYGDRNICPLCGSQIYLDQTNQQNCPDCGWSSL